MTNLIKSKIVSGGREILATYRGPNAAEGGYVAGGTVLNLATKPIGATPDAARALTSPMLQTRVDKVDFQMPAAMEDLYRLRYIPGAGSAPALGLAKVFGPPVVTVQHTVTLAEVVALGAFVGPLPINVAGSLACPANHYIVGARVTPTVQWAAPAATSLFIDVCAVTGTPDIVDSTITGAAGAGDAMVAANVGVGYVGLGAVMSETVFGPGTAPTAYPAATDVIIDATSIGGNLATFTAGEALVEIFCVNRLQAENFEGWTEVAAGTDLAVLGLTYNVSAEGA